MGGIVYRAGKEVGVARRRAVGRISVGPIGAKGGWGSSRQTEMKL